MYLAISLFIFLFSLYFSSLGFRRQESPTGRRQFPHVGYRLDAFNFEDDSHGWRFDMDMVIIYIYSANWVIGFIIFCLFCYFFFSSFWNGRFLKAAVCKILWTDKYHKLWTAVSYLRSQSLITEWNIFMKLKLPLNWSEVLSLWIE